MTSQDREERLTAALRAVERGDASSAVSSAVRERLLTEVRSIGRAQRRRAMTFLAAAAVVTIAALVSVWQLGVLDRLSDDQVSTPVAATAVAASRELTTPFFPLISASVPLTGSHIVRMEVPRRALASFGLMTPDLVPTSSETVLADVVVGDDGLARAVRFVRRATEQEQK